MTCLLNDTTAHANEKLVLIRLPDEICLHFGILQFTACLRFVGRLLCILDIQISHIESHHVGCNYVHGRMFQNPVALALTCCSDGDVLHAAFVNILWHVTRSSISRLKLRTLQRMQFSI